MFEPPATRLQDNCKQTDRQTPITKMIEMYYISAILL